MGEFEQLDNYDMNNELNKETIEETNETNKEFEVVEYVDNIENKSLKNKIYYQILEIGRNGKRTELEGCASYESAEILSRITYKNKKTKIIKMPVISSLTKGFIIYKNDGSIYGEVINVTESVIFYKANKKYEDLMPSVFVKDRFESYYLSETLIIDPKDYEEEIKLITQQREHEEALRKAEEELNQNNQNNYYIDNKDGTKRRKKNGKNKGH